MFEEDEKNEKKDTKLFPESFFDLSMMLTDSNWGEITLNPELIENLKSMRIDVVVDEKTGSVKYKPIKKDLWSLLSFYQRDLRLANLDHRELIYARYMLDLAGDLIYHNFVVPFLLTLSRIACVLETSQSKGGFLRRNFKTWTTEQKRQIVEPPRRGFFGKVQRKDVEGWR